jgi:TonB family protein
MSDDNNNIKLFSAADIERYWKGELSSAEMHAMEKAAMDDPFLADALEGYQYTASAGADVTFLRQKLNERTASVAKVVPMSAGRKFPWLRAAAAVVIIGSIAVLASQLFFNKSSNEVAKFDNNTAQQSGKTENVVTNAAPVDSIRGWTNANGAQKDTASAYEWHAGTKKVSGSTAAGIKVDTTFGYDLLATAEVKQNSPISVTPPLPEKLQPLNKAETKLDERSVVITDRADDKNFKDKEGPKDARKNEAYVESFKKSAENRSVMQQVPSRNNLFNGRVLDAQNNPVPFANVLNTRDNIGTYTDGLGNFNLISPDTAMDLQVRSLGYVTNNYRVAPGNNTFFLQEDAVARFNVLDTTNQRVASRTKKRQEKELEESEPEVGWTNYNVYVENNINIPDNISRQSGAEVELSFQVDKNGQPFNIRVTRSSKCDACDKEAVRLLKEGPKWKKISAKKGKTTVAFSVDK